VFVGDAGTTEANNPSRRYGVELASFWEATDWLVLDASVAYTDAKFRNVDPGFDRIPGAVETVVSVGAVARWGNLTTSLRVRHFGKAPLIEDNSVTSDPTTLVNFGASYDLGRFQIKLDVFNLLDSDSNDITYFYASRLRNEAAPVDDYHFHPVEPRQVRVSLRTRF
jgi:outer membrane receptor protein involved in Fe transport